MKKISNVEVRFHNLSANNVIATSINTPNNVQGNGIQLVGGRDWYDDEEDF